MCDMEENNNIQLISVQEKLPYIQQVFGLNVG